MNNPNSKNPPLTEFEKRFVKKRFSKIKAINNIGDSKKYEGQPSFIRFGQLTLSNPDAGSNNHREVAFLGMSKSQIASCVGNYYYPLKMVIPRFFRLVKNEVLLEKISQNESGKVVIDDELFFPGELQANVLLDVFLNISNDPRSVTGGSFFHACHEIQPLHGQVCHHLALSMDNMVDRNNCPYQLLVFYICHKDIKKGDEFDGDCGQHKESPPALDIIRKHWKLTPDTGYFFIPLLHADQSIVYYGFPNMDYTNDKGEAFVVKQHLKNWYCQIAQFDPIRSKSIVPTDDAIMPPIDRWSVSVCKDTTVTVMVENERIKC